MDTDKQLRFVIQVSGVALVIYSLINVLSALARYIALRFSGDLSRSFWGLNRLNYVEPIVFAALLLIPAWVLLAKTDWCTRAIADLSKPREEPEAEE